MTKLNAACLLPDFKSAFIALIIIITHFEWQKNHTHTLTYHLVFRFNIAFFRIQIYSIQMMYVTSLNLRTA